MSSVTLEDLGKNGNGKATQRTGSSSTVLPSAASRERGLGNRRVRIALIVAVLAVSVVGVTVTVQSAGAKQDVLVVARAVAPGQTITDKDLRVVRVASDSGVDLVASSRRGVVVNQVAGVALVPGVPLSMTQLATGPRMAPGEVEVALALKVGQVPPSVRPDDHVSVVRVSAASQPSAEGVAPIDPILVPDARVATFKGPSDKSSETLVSLYVSADKAPAVVQSSGAGQIALMRIGGSQ